MADVEDFADVIAAQIAGDSPVMDRVAEELAGRARRNAAKDQAFRSSIRVVKAGRGKDRLVEATDPLAGPKELGHVIRNEPDGPVLGYVKGLRYMRNALESMPEVKGD